MHHPVIVRKTMAAFMIIFVLVGFVLLFLLLTLGGIIAEHGEKNGLVKLGTPKYMGSARGPVVDLPSEFKDPTLPGMYDL